MNEYIKKYLIFFLYRMLRDLDLNIKAKVRATQYIFFSLKINSLLFYQDFIPFGQKGNECLGQLVKK